MSNTMNLAKESEEVQRIASIPRISVNQSGNEVEIHYDGETYTGQRDRDGIMVSDKDFDGSETQRLLDGETDVTVLKEDESYLITSSERY